MNNNGIDYAKIRRMVLDTKKQNDDDGEQNEVQKSQYEVQKIRHDVEEQQIHVHPDAMAPDAATLLYIIAMAVATIFKGRILIWIVLTIIWRRHMVKFGK